MRRRPLSTLLFVVVLGLGSCGGDAEPSSSQPGPASLEGSSLEGSELAVSLGCSGCHTTNGDRAQGPTWKGLAGSEVALANGTTVVADRAYLMRSIDDPSAEVVDGFIPLMPDFDLDPEEVEALVSYIEALR